MGLVYGKATIQPVEDKLKKETNTEPVQVSSYKETASQLVNGDANAVSNVPPIDGVVIEPSATKSTTETQPNATGTSEEAPENTTQRDHSGDEPNGAVNTTETSPGSEVEKKKNKNPLVWIKRRISKKSSAGKRPSAEQAVTDESVAPKEEPQASPAGAGAEVAGTQPDAETDVTETAASLVQEVLSSAMVTDAQAVHRSTVETTPEPPPEVIPEVKSDEPEVPVEQTLETTTHPVEESVDLNKTEPAISPCDVPLVSEVAETPLVNGDHEQEEPLVEEEEEVPVAVVDTNNTNVDDGSGATPELDLSHSAAHAESVAVKLAGLELSNGHPTHLGGSDDAITTIAADVVANGD